MNTIRNKYFLLALSIFSLCFFACQQDEQNLAADKKLDIDTVIMNMERFEAFSVKQANITKKVQGDEVFTIPKSALHSYHGPKISFDLVTIINHNDSLASLDKRYVEVIEQRGKFVSVTGIKNGDLILLEPVQNLRRLNALDHSELIIRFQ